MTRNFEILQDKQIQFRKEIGFLLKSQINEGEEMSGGGGGGRNSERVGNGESGYQ